MPTPPHAAHRPSTRIAGLVLLVLMGAAVAYGLGGYPLLDPDEGRNAEVARETWTSGQPLVPHLDGLPYLDKPILFFAVDAVAQKLLGSNELAARLPSLLWTLATALLTGAFARRWFGSEAGWIGAVAALAAPLPVVFARVVIFDAQLAFCVTAALLAFHEAIEGRAEKRAGAGRWGALAWAALAWTAISLGVLTKGPVALAVPLLVAVPYGLWRRAARAVFPLAGFGIFLVLVVPWVVVMQRAVPDYLHYALVAETWQRLTTGRFERTGPVWFFLPCLLVGAMPWSFVALGGLRKSPDRRRVFLLLWIVLPFLLFSLSQSKRPQYILPLLPAVALAVAAAWSGEAGDRLPGARAGAAAWLAWGLLLLAGGWYLPGHSNLPVHQVAALTRLGWSWGSVALAAGAVAWWVAGRRRSTWTAVTLASALALPAAALPLLLSPALSQVGPDFSARRLATAIAPWAPPTVEVVGLRAYPPSLPFYLKRTIAVVGPRGRELTSNYIVHSFAHWLEVPGTPLRPLDGWQGDLVACTRPALYVVHSADAANRAELAAAGLPLRYADGEFAAYGPCRLRVVNP